MVSCAFVGGCVYHFSEWTRLPSKCVKRHIISSKIILVRLGDCLGRIRKGRGGAVLKPMPQGLVPINISPPKLQFAQGCFAPWTGFLHQAWGWVQVVVMRRSPHTPHSLHKKGLRAWVRIQIHRRVERNSSVLTR